MANIYFLDDDGRPVPRHVSAPGAVEVAALNGSNVISFDSAVSRERSLIAAYLHVARGSMARVVLRDRAKAGMPDVITSRAEAQRLLSRLIDHRAALPKFARHALPLEASFFAHRWRAAYDAVTTVAAPEMCRDYLDHVFDGKFTLMRRGAGDTFYRAAMVGWNLHSHAWCAGFIKIGEPFRALEAADYGRWIDEGFASITPETGPKAEAIDATVGYGGTEGVRLTYQRIVLPFAARGGDACILTASVVA